VDKFTALADVAQFATVILGNQANEFELVRLESVPLSPEEATALQTRGMGFVGLLGLVDGKFRSALAVELDAATTAAIAQAFVESMVQHVRTRPKGDSVNWLEQLMRLPDPRREN
jgi:hypothetical protein